MTAATEPIVLLDAEDLAEADLDADLAARLDGWVTLRGEAAGAPDGRADAVPLAGAVHRGGAAAAAAHEPGLRAAMLAG